MRKNAIKLAKKMSEMSKHPKAQIGAVVIRGSVVVGSGFNTLDTHPKSPNPWKTCHAEFLSILNCKIDVNGCDIYVYRSTKEKNIAMAKPCKYCEKFLIGKGIRRVYYTTTGGLEKMRL